MERRFFCIIFAQDRKHLVGLDKFGMDIFQPTARITAEQQFVIEGLLKLEDIINLIDHGYRVLVEEDSSKRSRASEIMSAEEWIEEFERK